MPTKAELRAKLEALLLEEGASFGSDALAGELVDVIEKEGKVLRLDPETPALPRRLTLKDNGAVREVWADDHPISSHLFTMDCEVGRVFSAAFAAYNREREEEEMEAEVGPILDEGIPRLLEMELAKEAEKVAGAERARYLAIFDAFLADLPEGWDFVRMRARKARASLAAGTPAGEPADSHGLCAAAPSNSEPSPERPELVHVGGFVGGWLVGARAGDTPYLRDLTLVEVNEVKRRWQQEPVLREKIDRAVAHLRKTWPITTSERFGFHEEDITVLYRILTGKEGCAIPVPEEDGEGVEPGLGPNLDLGQA